MPEPGIDVAVIGMACVFPGAPDLETYWRNIVNGRDCIGEASEDRMDALFFDPSSRDPDRIYCRRGGFLPEPLDFDAAGFGIMPRAAEGADPDQLLALSVASRCLTDAGYEGRPFDRSRTGVILGRGGYLTPGLARLDQKVRGAQQLVEALRTVVPGVGEEQLDRIRKRFQEQVGVFGPDTAIGLVPNLTASRVSNRLDLLGPAYTVDGACASSLLAVDMACREIRSGRCEMVLAGGVHVTHDPTFWAVFCQLGALSRSGHIRPFDRRADGLLIGEGCGLLLLKGGPAAERDGDRIYARILGVGVASDGRSSSLFNPRVEGQVAALEQAWREAGRDPVSVGLVEAHGTGTPAGDAAELDTLARVFGPANGGPRSGLGSVKSMIGHVMPAAGAAGLIKAVLSAHHGVVPPSLHCDEPHPALSRTRFYVPTGQEPWPGGAGGDRVAAVNAFGFGGINAHVVLEARGRPQRVKGIPVRERTDVKVVAIAADSPKGLLRALELGIPRGGDGRCRLSLVDPTPERIARARRIVERGVAWHGRQGIWFSPQALARDGGRVLFMYPGIEAIFEPRVTELASRFGLEAPELEAADLEQQGRAVVELGLFLHRLLERIGVKPDGLAGHSIGEWTGMMTSGIMDEADVFRLVDGLRPGSLEVPGVLFAAAGCGLPQAEGVIEDLPEIAISHDNCPHQVILCGRAESIETARDRLIGQGVICQVLPFRSGFHSPLFAPYLEPHRKHFGALPMRAASTPLYSATNADAYPEDSEAIKKLAVDHLVRPLRFREMIESLYEKGYRIFVQVGAGSLTGFVEDCLKGRPHLSVSAGESGKSGLAQFRNLALALFTEGLAVDLDRLVPSASSAGIVRLELGSRLVRLDPGLALGRPAVESAASARAGSALLTQFEQNLGVLSQTQQDVMKAFDKAVQADTWADIQRLSVHTVPALRDHSIFAQPDGWERVSDRYPVVPMTMTIELLLEAARQVSPGRVPTVMHDLQAMRWLLVEPEVEVRRSSRRLAGGEAEVEVEDYARARVALAPGYPEPPAADRRPLTNPRPAPIEARELYDDRWMFHGPRYQGVVELTELADDGVRGVLEVTDAPGALLDNAGQLFGYWVMATQPQDRLAMPLGIAKLELFGPHPSLGERLECAVRITKCDEIEVQADLEVHRQGRVWARIHGWTDLRFTSDDRMWNVMRHPETNVLSEERDGWVLYDDAAQRAPSRDWLTRRYLGEPERQAMYEAGPRRQRHYLNGRIAAKDAVRLLLWSQGHGPIFPVEVSFSHDEKGRPRVEGLPGWDVRISLAHTGDVAVACAGLGRDVGIDVERIEDRPEGFDEHAFAPQERRWLGDWGSADEEALREWRTRLWCAKEAVAKSRGTGFGGNPSRLVVETRDGQRLRVDGIWVETRREGPYVIAWTGE